MLLLWTTSKLTLHRHAETFVAARPSELGVLTWMLQVVASVAEEHVGARHALHVRARAHEAWPAHARLLQD